MRPEFEITVINGANVTKNVRERLISLSISDSIDQQADTLDMLLDDRDYKLATPKDGTMFQLSLGYAEAGKLVDQGIFYYDETEFNLTTQKLSIRARATNFANSFKEPKQRSFSQKLLGEILTSLATDNGYLADIHDDFFWVDIQQLDQNKESDLKLVDRLRKEFGAAFKIQNNTLRFYPLAAGPRIKLTPGEITGGRATSNVRAQWGAVEALVHDVSTAGSVTARAEAKNSPAGAPVLKMAAAKDSLERTQLAAEAELSRQLRSRGSLNLTLPGRPDLKSNSVLVLEGWREGINGEWLVKRVNHNLDSGGYVCSLEAEILNWYSNASANNLPSLASAI